jgi:hypothetical protein
MVTEVEGEAPEASPLQPWKEYPAEGEANSWTTVPAVYWPSAEAGFRTMEPPAAGLAVVVRE